MTPTDTSSPCHRFRALHRAPGGFLMPNAWDAGSAIVLAGLGFDAIGTTSAGIAFALGKPDHDVRDERLAVRRDEMIEALRRIASAVHLPVNADLESGYGERIEDIVDTATMALQAGAAGLNLEDLDRTTGRPFERRQAVERVRAVCEAIKRLQPDFVVNARTDTLLEGGDGLAEAIARANLYLQAGADCVFVPGITDLPRTRTLVAEVHGPLNLVVGLNEAGSSAHALRDAGVQRISVGGSIVRAALGLVRRAGEELLRSGTVGYASQQLSHGELNALFTQARSARDAAG